MRSILVTRPQPAADELAAKLRREGHRVFVAPMTEYVEVPADYRGLDAYQALIFTSAQAVRIFASHTKDRHHAVLAVGDTTATVAARAGFTNVYSANGDSDNVAELIRQEAKHLHLKDVLHVCSDDTTDSIGRAVEDIGVRVLRLVIYKAQYINRLPAEVTQALHKNAIDVVTVFSARAAENLVRLLSQKDLRGVSAQMDAVCISPRAAVALKGIIPWREIRVARQPRLEAMLEVLHRPDSGAERRERTERRTLAAQKDSQGLIRQGTYHGPDRRTSIGRRGIDTAQKQKIAQERWKFANRAMLTVSFMFIAIVLAGVFIMAPEYARMTHGGGLTADGFSINKYLKEMRDTATETLTPVLGAAGHVATNAIDAARKPNSAAFTQLMQSLDELKNTNNNPVIEQSLKSIYMLMRRADDPDTLAHAVDEARKHDPELKRLMGGMKKEDLAAGAMLLALNEFRNNVSNSRPYAADIAILQKYTGNSPSLNRALRRLTPYAEKGIMSRSALQAEFKTMATNVVISGLRGEDVSIRDEAQRRYEHLTQMPSPDAVTGEDTAATVARAKLLLDTGDVKSAVRELQQLDGAEAEAASPWVDNAAGQMIASQSSDELAQGLLQQTGGDNASVEELVRLIKETLQGPTVPYISPALTRGGNGGKDVLAPAH